MRVLAVSAESSLAAALNMMDGWEVVFAEPEGVSGDANGAAVILAGGGTVKGLEVIGSLRARGVGTPAVVLGDVAPDGEAEALVLMPPFTLDELRSAVEGAAVTHTSSATASLTSLELPPPDAIEESSEAAEQTAQVAAVPDERDEAPLGTSGDDSARQGGNGALSPASLDVAEVTPSEPPAATGSPTVAPPVQPPPQDPARVAEPEAKKRWRRHRDDDAPVDSPPPVVEVGSIPARLRAAEDAARTIEGIIRDLPLLADLEALSQALIGEVVDAFSPEVACLYLPSADGFWVAAGHQLTPAERRLAVKREHPLIRELLTTGEPMLIAPLDLARHMVGGIAGARTEAFITGPVRAGEACVGVVIVGRGDFDDKDLDRLAELTAEAAPGLAVAEAIDRLRALRPR